MVVAGLDDRVPLTDTEPAGPDGVAVPPTVAVTLRGAVPQTSQYPSTMSPLQPGCAHLCVPAPGEETGTARCAPGLPSAAAVSLRGAIPQTSQYPSTISPLQPGCSHVSECPLVAAHELARRYEIGWRVVEARSRLLDQLRQRQVLSQPEPSCPTLVGVEQSAQLVSRLD
jgi:hypothetical protein